MKVLLLQHVKKIGQKGDIVEVSDGYATSFLIPKKFARTASERDALSQAQFKKQQALNKQSQLSEEEELFRRLQGKKVEIISPANPQGHLFGAVGRAEIGAALPGLKSEYIVLKHGIKEIGEHSVPITIGGKKGSITVVIK